jgi:universal stress protein E
MQPIRRILVAVKDPSARALPAVNKAAQIAKGLNAQLTLFHDIATPLYAEALQGRDVDLKSWQREVQAAKREQLEKLAARVRKHGIDVDVAGRLGLPALRGHHPQGAANLRRLVSRRESPWHRPAPGSLAAGYTDWELLRLCPIPGAAGQEPAAVSPPAVLAAIDPSHAHAKPTNLDRQILRAACSWCTRLHGELHALHAVLPTLPVVPSMPDGPLVDVGAERAEIEAAARNKLARAVDGFDVKRSHCYLVAGRPNDVIPRTARRERCSIVAMGRGVALRAQRFFIGNTAEFVMDAVTADILVEKPPDFESRVPRAGRGVQILSLPVLPG